MRTWSWVENMYGCDCGAEDCSTCHPENQVLLTCECCGEKAPRYDMYDDILCPTCYNEGAQVCPSCGTYVIDMLEYNGEQMCEQCMLEMEAQHES